MGDELVLLPDHVSEEKLYKEIMYYEKTEAINVFIAFTYYSVWLGN